MKLVLEKVHKTLLANGQPLPIIRGVSFQVAEKEVLCIMGPSGAGKTTLLRMINRLEDPTSGRIILDGVDLSALDVLQLRRRVGMLFQAPALFQGTVIENLTFPLKLRGIRPSEADLLSALALVGLPAHLLPRDSSQLSAGEQHRVSLARTLIAKPEVLLMDEPAASLDPSATRHVLELVRELNRRLGITVLMVSHIPEHGRQIASRALLLIGGEVVEEGDPDSVLSTPRSDLARRFIAGTLD